MAEFYEQSGKYPPTSIGVIPLLTAFMASVIGIIYAYICWYNPFIYIGVALPFLYAVAVNLSTSWVLKHTPVRNSAMAFVLFFVGGVIGYVFHALVWLNLFVNQTDSVHQFGSGSRAFGFVVSTVNWGMLVDELLHIDYSFSYLMMILDKGVWTLFGNEVMGTPYKLVWLAEFLIFTISLAILAKNDARRPFCEEMGQYFQKLTLPKLLRVPFELDDLEHRFQQGEFGYVFVAEVEPEKKYNHLKVDLYYLDYVDDAYLTVTLVTHKGKNIESTKLIEFAGLPRIQADQLIRRFGGETTAYPATYKHA
jgi:uncharacterized membrane protein YciS (DUF1049 family)